MVYFEEWRHIRGFEGVYLISNKGRLMSKRGKKWHLRSNVNSKGDYLAVILRHGDKEKHTRIHRLVYEAFVGEIPKGKKYHIHHIDHNKQNNAVDNLALENAKLHIRRHLNEGSLMCKAMNHYNRFIKPKAVKCISLDGEVLGIFPNAQDAGSQMDVCPRNILQVAGKSPYNKKGSIRKQAGGYIWEFVN